MRGKENILNCISDILEYSLVFLIVIECNSLFNNSIDNGSANINAYLCDIILCVLLALIVIRLLSHPFLIAKAKGSISLLLSGMVFYSVLFLSYNVLKLGDTAAATDFVNRFLLYLPFITFYFWEERELGNSNELFYKHADFMCIYCVLSAALYLAVLFRPDSVSADIVKSRWSNLGRIKYALNYYNICGILQSGTSYMLGIPIFKNFGIFTEPLMFCVQLIPALFTEMFLREKSARRVWKWILISFVILTSQATLGVMLLVMAWGLKGLWSFQNRYSGGKRKFVLAGIICASALCVMYLFRAKASLSTSDLSSFAVHLEDYKLGIKAFLSRPFRGCGYNNEDYIRTFMSESRLANNRGFSNSITIVLAEGGLFFGAFCLLPFFLGFLNIRDRARRELAFWTAGVFGLYTLTIFHFHYFLLTIYGFLYSSVGFRESVLTNEGTRSEEEKKTDGNKADENKTDENKTDAGKRFRTRARLTAAVLVVLFLIWPQGLLHPFYGFLKSHQLYLGQSAWKLIFFVCMVIINAVLVRDLLREGVRKTRILAGVAAPMVIYALLYDTLYSELHTVLMLHGDFNDALESGILFAVYLGVLSVCLILTFLRGFLWKHRAVGIPVVLVLILLSAGAFHYVKGKERRYLDFTSEDLDAIALLRDVKPLHLYADDYPWLYHMADQAVSYSGTRDNGYAAFERASVIMPHDRDCDELFDSGWEITEISYRSVLYSNDPEVIRLLKAHGYSFYHYYPYDKEVDLGSLASLNGLPMDEAGGIVVTGEGQSLNHGPYDVLQASDYTADFSLHLDREVQAALESRPEDEVICTLRISYNYGENIVKSIEVAKRDFDFSGDAVIAIPFHTVNCEGAEYLISGKKDYSVSIRSIKLRKTPSYVTVSTYNGRKQPVFQKYYQPDGTPYQMSDGYSQISYRYDFAGDLAELHYFDAEGKPVLISKGYASEKRYYRAGENTRSEYFGTDGSRTLTKSGYSAVDLIYDSERRVVRQKYYDTNDAETLIHSGYAEIAWTYNDKNRRITEQYFGIDGAPIALPTGQASEKWGYDDAGNVIDRKYFDVDNKPVVISAGYAEIRREFNEAHQIIYESYYDENGSPVSVSAGYHAVEREYDRTGNVVLQRYFDTADQPVVVNAGYAEEKRVYNDKRQVIQVTYCGADGNPVITKGGYAERHWTYNEQSQIITESYFGLSGEPIVLPSGQASDSRSYDEDGNLIDQIFYDLDGNRILLKSGYAEVKRSYDSLRRVTQVAYYDLSGEPVNCTGGYQKIVYVYDEEGKLSKTRYFDTAGAEIQK